MLASHPERCLTKEARDPFGKTVPANGRSFKIMESLYQTPLHSQHGLPMDDDGREDMRADALAKMTNLGKVHTPSG